MANDAKTIFNQLFDDFKASEFFGTAVKSISISITSGGTIDPITGNITGGGTTVYTADGWFRDPNHQEFAAAVGGDVVFTVKQDDLGYKPVFDDEVVISGGSSWDGAYRMKELKADGADVVYKMLLRR